MSFDRLCDGLASASRFSGCSPCYSFWLPGGSIHRLLQCTSNVACRHGFTTTPYRERYKFVPLSQISPNLQHAVIAAEDARFYQHHGFDWHAIQIAADDDLEGGRTRGASTITQQLVKNLFFGTGRSILRKGAEFTLVPAAELFLGKRRILEIYLNVIEWGPGIYGADAACHYYDGTPARNADREQAARLAAILPAPLKRRPARMNHYSASSWSECDKWAGNYQELSVSRSVRLDCDLSADGNRQRSYPGPACPLLRQSMLPAPRAPSDKAPLWVISIHNLGWCRAQGQFNLQLARRGSVY